MTEQNTPAPDWNPEIAGFRSAAARGSLLLKTCKDCGETHFYPRSICPFCFSDNTEWRTSSGKGTVYSFSIQRRVLNEYVIAMVTLDEGPTMMTHLVDLPAPEDAKIGQAVELVFRPGPDGDPLPMFRPAP